MMSVLRELECQKYSKSTINTHRIIYNGILKYMQTADSKMKRKALENAYIDLVTDELPKWENDSDLMKWLNDLCD
jgi:hypothetical protein